MHKKTMIELHTSRRSLSSGFLFLALAAIMVSMFVGCTDEVEVSSGISVSGSWYSYTEQASLVPVSEEDATISAKSTTEILGTVTSFVTGSGSGDETTYDTFIIGYKDGMVSGSSEETVSALARTKRPGEDLGWTYVENASGKDLPFDRVEIPADRLESYRNGQSYDFDAMKDALNESLGTDAVSYVEPDYVRKAFAGEPNDAMYSKQWNMQEDFMNLPLTRTLSAGDSSVIVAVLDTGVDQSLDDLADVNFVEGYDFVNNDSDPTDDVGHGSHVTGTIAQSTNNGIGTSGIAPGVSIMPVKVLDSTGSGTTSALVSGIYYAVDNGADVINMSLGGTSLSQAEEDACAYADENGVLIVASAGNDGVTTKNYPAAIDSVIAVGAVGYSDPDSRASYSNYGSDWVDVMAYGGSLDDSDSIPTVTLSDGSSTMDAILQETVIDNEDGYYFYVGTSMAAPHVTGLAALLKSLHPSYTADELFERITETASEGDSTDSAYGVIDATAAVIEDVYEVSDTVTVSVDDATTVEASWQFFAATGQIEISLEMPSEDTGTYELSLEDEDGTAVATDSSDGSLSYEVTDETEGLYLLSVSYTVSSSL
jgi:serine protease